MHVNQEQVAAIIVLLCIGLLLWFLWGVFRALDRWIHGARVEPMPDLEAAKRLLEAPRQVMGTNEWVRTRCETEVCEGPRGPQQFEVHVPSDVAHRKTCRRCQEEHRRGAAIPHPSN